MKYKDQLKTSAWLRRKFDILQRDNYVCSNCLKDNFESQLEVHHLCYIKGKKVWQYQDYMLVTLCRECHQKEHDLGNVKNDEEFKNWIIKLLSKVKL